MQIEPVSIMLIYIESLYYLSLDSISKLPDVINHCRDKNNGRKSVQCGFN